MKNLNGNEPQWEGYRLLNTAIVEMAILDYIRILTVLLKERISNYELRENLIEKMLLEEFFYSEWYRFLSDTNPDIIILKCRTKALNNVKDTIREELNEQLKGY